jgi:TRAP-type C4-dicarboxylate transport system permease small subunit
MVPHFRQRNRMTAAALTGGNPKEPAMTQDPKPARGMPRSLIYAMIPGGFILLILILILSGFWTQEATDGPATVVEEPAAPVE